MKAIKRRIRKKGFSLVECMVAMAIFAMMATIVMQILGIAIARNLQNHRVEKDMDAQIQNIVDDNSLTDGATINLAFKFMTQGGADKTLSISNISLKSSNTGFEGGYQINTLSKDFENSSDESGTSDDSSDADDGTPGLIKSYNHIYGTAGMTHIIAEEDSITNIDATKCQVVWKFTVNARDLIGQGVLSSSVANSLKIALPKSAENITIVANDLDNRVLVNHDLKTRQKKGLTVRFSDPDTGTSEYDYAIRITFDITKTALNDEYESFAKYFVKGASATDSYKTVKLVESINGFYDKKA